MCVNKIMEITLERHMVVALIWLIFTPEALSDGLELPPIACPNFFRYQPRGRGYIGKITLDDVPFSTLNLEVAFSQKQPIWTKESFTGRLIFEHDLITVQKDFEDGNPISFNVEFPLATEIPKLINIKMNGEDICSANKIVEHTVVYTFRRSFTPTKGSHRTPKITTTSSTSTTEKPAPETADSILCGLTSFNEANVLLGEHNVTWGWFPWATKIYRQDKLDYGLTFTATGSLISTRTILTVKSSLGAKITADEIVVQLGVLGLIDAVESYPVSRRVKTLLTHPEYGLKTYSDADIALLQLDRPVSFNRYIVPICLWNEPEGTDVINPHLGYLAFFSRSGIDKVINGTIISQSQCLQSHKTNFSPRIFCVDYHNIFGPSHFEHCGSPLMFNRNGLWMLRGIYSACILNNGTCNANRFFVYSDVLKFRTWIRENLEI